jgi:hypothetical protein
MTTLPLDPQVAMQKVQLKQLNRLRLNHLKIKLK